MPPDRGNAAPSFGYREGAAKTDDPAEHPAEHSWPGRVQLRRQSGRNPKDATTDRDADDDRRGAERTQRARHALSPVIDGRILVGHVDERASVH